MPRKTKKPSRESLLDKSKWTTGESVTPLKNPAKVVKSTLPAFPEPESCANCGSTEKMSYLLASVNGKDNVRVWACDECGHTHLRPEPGYNSKLGADEQVAMEECIASTLFDYERNHATGPLDEEECNHLGREILKKVLRQFRPDLFTK